MDMSRNGSRFLAFSGNVMEIRDEDRTNGCYKIFMVEDEEGGIVNFVISPDTYFVDCAKITIGTPVTGFYDGNAPAILIYPPQFNAVVMAVDLMGELVKVDFFDRNLVSSDGTLRLILNDDVDIILRNGQDFNGNVANKNLVVVYSRSTRSIPAQTVPDQIIVLC